MFIALYSKRVFMGVKTWSWYIPIITSNFFLLFFKNIVSAGKGPFTFILFFKDLITGCTILISSLNSKILSQWGFKPKTAILGLNPKNFSTVIVNINEELVVKTFIKEKNQSFLTSGSKKIEDKINLTENPEILVWGIVTYVIHAL